MGKSSRRRVTGLTEAKRIARAKRVKLAMARRRREGWVRKIKEGEL